MDWSEFEDLEIIGVDEIALKRAIETLLRLFRFAFGMGLIEFSGCWKIGRRRRCENFLGVFPRTYVKRYGFCTDLYDGFIGAAKEFFGRKIRIVADRFHVAKLYRKGLDDLRKKEMKRLKKSLPKEEYKSFKTVMWVLRKNVDDLTEADIAVIKTLQPHAPELVMAYLLCLTLTNIFESQITKEQARSQLRGWKKMGSEIWY